MDVDPTLTLTLILNNLYRIYSTTYDVVLYYFAELAARPITISLFYMYVVRLR